MQTQSRKALLRGAAMLALAAAVASTSLIVPTAPTAEAAPLLKPKKEKSGNDNDGGGLGDVPIIGDIVGGFKDAEPEEIAVGAIQFTAAAAETVVPLVVRLFK